ncbi:WD40-repeat-containing domain protein [Mycena sp. CBHHK59/15]|nr:WD40-repeat-containing domain protein [Mycena sp. CBHHK59/15]
MNSAAQASAQASASMAFPVYSSSSSPPSTPRRRRITPALPATPNSTARFSRLLTSVLGSPFLTTSDMTSLPPHLDLVDGDSTAVPRADTVTRPPSPVAEFDWEFGFEVVKREEGDWGYKWAARTPSPFRSFLPRLWDVLSSSPGRLSPPRQPTFAYSNSNNNTSSSIWNTKPIDYTSLPPLDGEEGELIDDEACFFCPSYGVRAVTGVDILTLLPPELSLHILCLLVTPPPASPTPTAQTALSNLSANLATSSAAFQALVVCTRVSRKWRTLANDNAVWCAAFAGRWGTPPLPASLPKAMPTAVRHISMLDSRMKKLPALPPSDILVPTPAPTRPAPLMLDWRVLYRQRLELDRRWEATTAAERWEPSVMALSGHADSVYCLEFSDTHIITGSRDRTIKVWALRTGRLLATLSDAHRGSVLCLKFEALVRAVDALGEGSVGDSREGRGFMVSGSSDCSVRVWELTGDTNGEGGVRGEVKAVLKGHGGGVLDLRIDEEWIVSCSKDAAIRVWSRDTLELHRTLRGHEGPVNAVGLQSGRVVSASGDGKMILWDIASGERIRTFEGHDRGLACIEFKEDLIVSGSNDCKIKIWSAATGECLRTLVGHEALVRALAFDVRSGRLVSASYDKTVRVWDLGSGRLIREFKDSHTSHIFDVKFDARRIVSTSHDQKIVVLDFSSAMAIDPALFV